MKLANALSQRSELQERIRQLEYRLQNNAKVQEGETPAEDPMELLRELDSILGTGHYRLKAKPYSPPPRRMWNRDKAAAEEPAK